jgi:hypothetical protein
MTQEEILEYNKRCAKFLGYINTTPTDKDFDIYHNEKGMIIGNKIHTMIEPMSAKFHSDWNWIMEVIKSIQKIIIKNDEEFCIEFYQGLPNKSKTFVSIGELGTESEDPKEAVVQAINQFLIWYNTQKL